MSVPPKWRDPFALQQLVANNINPVLQGYIMPRYDTAPDNADGLFYYDTTLTWPAWNDGSAWNYFVGRDSSGNVSVGGTLKSSGGAIGYATGAGGSVAQITSRTTGVTLNTVCGAITLVSAAGSATWQTFTVTNSSVAATDTVIVNQKSGTDLYRAHVTAVAAGSFNITFATTGGTTTEQPVFNFAVIKGVTS